MTSNININVETSNEPTGYAGSNIVPASSKTAFVEGLTSCSQALISACPAVLMFIEAFKSR